MADKMKIEQDLDKSVSNMQSFLIKHFKNYSEVKQNMLLQMFAQIRKTYTPLTEDEKLSYLLSKLSELLEEKIINSDQIGWEIELPHHLINGKIGDAYLVTKNDAYLVHQVLANTKKANESSGTADAGPSQSGSSNAGNTILHPLAQIVQEIGGDAAGIAAANTAAINFFPELDNNSSLVKIIQDLWNLHNTTVASATSTPQSPKPAAPTSQGALNGLAKFGDKKSSDPTKQAYNGLPAGRTDIFNYLRQKAKNSNNSSVLSEEEKNEIKSKLITTSLNELNKHDVYGNHPASVVLWEITPQNANYVSELVKFLFSQQRNGEYLFDPYKGTSITVMQDPKLDIGLNMSMRTTTTLIDLVFNNRTHDSENYNKRKLPAEETKKLESIIIQEWINRVNKELAREIPNLEPYLDHTVLEIFFALDDFASSPLTPTFEKLFNSGLVDIDSTREVVSKLPEAKQSEAVMFLSKFDSVSNHDTQSGPDIEIDNNNDGNASDDGDSDVISILSDSDAEAMGNIIPDEILD